MAHKRSKATEPTLLLRCGCAIRFRDGEPPLCPSHGNQAVARVLHMPAPRIVGVATGPHVQTRDLPAHVGRLIGNEPKDAPHGE